MSTSYFHEMTRSLPFLFLLAPLLYAATLDRTQPRPVAAAQTTVSSSSASTPTPETPASPPTLDRASADRAYSQGQFATARAAYRKLAAQADKPMELLLWSVRSGAALPDSLVRQESRALLDSLLAQLEPESPYYAEAQLLSGFLYASMGKTNEAVRDYRRAKSSGGIRNGGDLVLLCKALSIQDSSIAVDCPGRASSPTSSSSTESGTGNTAATSRPPLSSSSGNTRQDDSWTLQLGAFSKRQNADLLVRTLADKQIQAQVVTRESQGKSLWLVWTGSFPSRDAAQAWAEQRLTPLQLDFRPISTP